MGEKKESQKSIKRLENIPVFSRVQETSDNLLNFSLNESRSDCNEQNVNVESSIPWQGCNLATTTTFGILFADFTHPMGLREMKLA